MYTPLKVTTDFSILKSLIKVKDLIDFCVQKKLTACAICDSNLFGVIEFFKLAKKNNIKPIIGLELNIDNTVEVSDKIIEISILKQISKIVFW